MQRNVQVDAATDTCTSYNEWVFDNTTVDFSDDHWNLAEEVIACQSLGGSSHIGKFLSQKLMQIVGKFHLTR